MGSLAWLCDLKGISLLSAVIRHLKQCMPEHGGDDAWGQLGNSVNTPHLSPVPSQRPSHKKCCQISEE